MLKVDAERRADVDEIMSMPMVYVGVKEKEFADWERRLNEKEDTLREREVMLMQQQKQFQMQMQMYSGSQMSNYTSYKSTNANTAEGSESKEKHSDNSINTPNSHLYMKNSNSTEYVMTTQQNQMNIMDNSNRPYTTRQLDYKLKEKMAAFMSNNNIGKSCEYVAPIAKNGHNTCEYRTGCSANYNNVLEVYGSVEVMKRNENGKRHSEPTSHDRRHNNCENEHQGCANRNSDYHHIRHLNVVYVGRQTCNQRRG